MRSPERHTYLEAALAALTVAASWATGISLLLVAVSSGAITLAELRSNPLDDTERREWPNKMLYYGLVCVISFTVAFLYLPALYFAL